MNAALFISVKIVRLLWASNTGKVDDEKCGWAGGVF